MKRRSLLAISIACVALLQVASVAHGKLTYQSSFGSAGTGAGQFSRPAGVAVSHATGDVYVVDRGNHRVQQFTEAGSFVRAWGYDVIASGGNNEPFVDEVAAVKIRATGGSFRLTFKGQSTGPLSYDASPGDVQTALNGLSTISSGGGSVTVTGGPGDATGSSPYVVTFNGGPLQKTDVELGIDPTNLALPPGTELTCNKTSVLPSSTGTQYQWLANGEPVAEATSPTFTPSAAEAGKAVQCQMRVTYGDGNQSLGASQPHRIAAGNSPTAPPLAPPTFGSSPPAPASSVLPLKVNESNGAVLTCNATPGWTGSPESYTYRWYRNGTEIGSPNTTPNDSSTYTLTAEDTAEKAVFQCSIEAKNAGGSSVAFSGLRQSDPGTQAFNMPFGQIDIPATSSSKVITQTNGGPPFEICQGLPPSTDVCKAGAPGSGFGEFNLPRSIAVDNSAGGAGDVYVHDELNFRVQKFSAAGEPVLAFGKGVNESTDGDVCTEASGDACGRGAFAIDETPGSIGLFGEPSFDYPKEHRDLGNQLAVDQAGHVYLAEPRRPKEEVDFPLSQFACPERMCGPRIQKWNADGTVNSFAKLKTYYAEGRVGERPERFRPISIGVNSEETAFVTLAFFPAGIERVFASEFAPNGGKTNPVGNIFLPQAETRQVAIDPRNDRPLFSDINEKETQGSEGTSICGGPREGETHRAVIHLDVRMNMIDCTEPLGAARMTEVTGMAIDLAGNLYAAAGNANVVKVFSLPVPEAPEVGAQAAKRTTTQSSELHAQIDAGFEDTSYRVEYGLADCAVSTCASAPGPAELGGLGFTDAAVTVSGLQPGKTYYYRFIAENPIGADVGDTKTFSTYPFVDLVNDSCTNALARKQTRSVGLLDCRAYELVSAGWTGGYDVVSNLVQNQTPFDAHPDAQDRVLYGVKDGGIPGTGNPTNRGIDPYVAERDNATGWQTRYVGIESNNPYATGGPFSSTLLGAAADLKTFVFGGPEICAPCFADGSSGMPLRLPSGELVQGMTGSQPDPAVKEAGHVAEPLSADGRYLVFGTTSALEPAATGGQETLYQRPVDSSVAEVISTRSDGSTMTGDVGELAISSDGSRVVVAEETGTDAGGNPLWHPFLHIRGSANSIDLTRGATTGVQVVGMSADGSTVYLSTLDQLPVDQPTQDTDQSIDIYRAHVNAAGSLSLELITVMSDGSVSNDDGCETAGIPDVWNAIEGDEGRCNAVPLAGGAGVAAVEGDVFFVSPEQFEPGQGIENQANLYVVRADGTPAADFVALLDSALEKPGPSPVGRPLRDGEFGDTELMFPGEITVDQSNQDVYALELGFGEGNVFRFHPDGTPHDFTAGPGKDTNRIPVSFTEFGSANQIAVDNSPTSAATALEDALYVPLHSGVRVFAQSGESLGQLTGAGTAPGSFGRACGVAVDQSTGVAYVADRNGRIWQYTPSAPAAPIADSDYTVKGIATPGVAPCSIAADRLGNVYAANLTEYFDTPGKVYRWAASSFQAGSPPSVAGTEVALRGTALSIDPDTDDLYVNTGKEIQILDSSGSLLAEGIGLEGPGELKCPGDFFLTYSSRGVAVNATTKHTYASCMDTFESGGFRGTVREWGHEQVPYVPIDHPAIVNGVHQPEEHSWGDFQVTPDGGFAAFSTVVPLKAAYDNGGRHEIYRYDGDSADIVCVSCDPTGSQASTDSVLPPNGLGLLEDGRVFFNTGEALTLADTNEKLDAYEWSPPRSAPGGCSQEAGCQQLISTGTSAHPSALLGVTADGEDAFFFTRETLVSKDRNGEAMKIYDAREQGGFFVIPPPPPCAAADECHGPSTQAQAPPQIGSYKGVGGQAQPATRTCRKGFKLKRGKCVKKQKKPKHRKSKKGSKRPDRSAGRGGNR